MPVLYYSHIKEGIYDRFRSFSDVAGGGPTLDRRATLTSKSSLESFSGQTAGLNTKSLKDVKDLIDVKSYITSTGVIL